MCCAVVVAGWLIDLAPGYAAAAAAADGNSLCCLISSVEVPVKVNMKVTSNG